MKVQQGRRRTAEGQRRRTSTAEKKLGLLAEYHAADRDGMSARWRGERNLHLPHLGVAQVATGARSCGHPAAATSAVSSVSISFASPYSITVFSRSNSTFLMPA